MIKNSEFVEVDILVVGYGPVGATLAALLGRYGIRTLVIDKLSTILNIPRAIALDNEALRILQMVGITENSFEQIAINEVNMLCPFLGQFGKANTRGTIDGHPKLVTFYQPELEKALRLQVGKQKSVESRLEVELLNLSEGQDGVTAELRKMSGEVFNVKAKYLVGADGASSRVRNLIGQDFEGETYQEDWLVVDAVDKSERPMSHVEFFCDPERPAPHMPAPGGRKRWEFMLRDGEKKEEMEQPEKVSELLSANHNLEDCKVERQAVYRFHARCCDSFQKGRVFLVGDAAHVTPPFVGQGLVAGLRDVANLAWKLSWVIDGRAHPDVLRTYDLERRPHAKEMIDLAKFMGKLVMPQTKSKAILIHGIMRLLRFIPPARNYFEELKVKPKNQFKRGLFQKGKSNSKLVRGGQLPQELFRTSNGISWSDNVLGNHMVLVGIGIDPREKLDDELEKKWIAMGGKFLQVGTRGIKNEINLPFAEPTGDIFLNAYKDNWIVVVRPDRVIIDDGAFAKANEMVRGTLNMLGN